MVGGQGGEGCGVGGGRQASRRERVVAKEEAIQVGVDGRGVWRERFLGESS